MKGLLAFMSQLMLFLTLATLLTAFASFVAHKLKQRAKPQAGIFSARSHAAAPSLVQAYDPSQKRRAEPSLANKHKT